MTNEIMIHNEDDLRSKIYTIRGVQVMLDFDLAEIYGYETKMFNRQVKNNIERFDDDFRFQLTHEEFEESELEVQIMHLKFRQKNTRFSKLGREKVFTLRFYRTRYLYAYDSFTWKSGNATKQSFNQNIQADERFYCTKPEYSFQSRTCKTFIANNRKHKRYFGY